LQKLDIYVFGSGEYGELGLGHVIRNGKKPKGVLRPRLNDLLGANTIGIVQIAVGGMHCVALSHDHRIFTWGVNDNSALGRDITRDGDDDDDDGMDLNPKESTPTAISSDFFGKDTKFAQVVASDSASFALTVTGSVYGWGTFSVRFSISLSKYQLTLLGRRWHHRLLQRRYSRGRSLKEEGYPANTHSHPRIKANQAPCRRRESYTSLGP
jgi:alpha-tubulin suppressor-like RCC1 family protein